jgi:uncharacterized RDD family membrane protein YckC
MESQAPDMSDPVVGALDVPLDLPLAHVGTRALAVLVDTLILILLFVALFAGMALLWGALPGGFAELLGVAMAWATFLLYWGYFAGSEQLLGGQTPGKRLLGLRVVARDGTDVGPLASIVRNLLRVIDMVPATYGVGVAAMLLSPRAQRLGDMAAGTLVVRERSGRMEASQADRFWPEGFTADEVALVEHYFRVEPTLQDDARERIASLVLRWIEKEHPRSMEGVATGIPASVRVHRVFTLGLADPRRRGARGA